MFKTAKDIDIKNKKILFRVAYDITLEQENGKWIVPDATRIEVTLPTLRYLLENNCPVVILTWLGRPGGKYSEECSLKPVAEKLSEFINQEVKFASSCRGEAREMVKNLRPGEVLLLENVRFCEEEDQKDFSFAKELVFDCDYIVFDAFAQAHRDVPSVTGILNELPAVAGFVVEKEVAALSQIIKDPPQPYVVILGGAKVGDKIEDVKNFVQKADKILLGGGLANLFLKVNGTKIANSVADGVSIRHKGDGFDIDQLAKDLFAEYKDKIVLPVDLVAAKSIDENPKTEIVDLAKDQIKDGWQFLDIGPKTEKLFKEQIKNAKALFWNGPLGLYEIDKFDIGSRKIAKAIAKNKQCLSVIGGGDTEMAISKFGLDGKFSHVSTGGGASLELVSKGELAAFEALKNNQEKHGL